MSNGESTPTPSLAERINQAHRLVLHRTKSVVERAIACGELLIEAREKEAEPRKWLEWLKKNCPDVERTARRYVRLAENEAKIEKWAVEKLATLANLTLAEAERIAGEGEQPTEQQTEDQQTTDKSVGQPTTRQITQPTTRHRLTAYTKAADILIEKLRLLSADAARDNADRTIDAINETVEDLEAKEKKSAA
jgi:hypothetical protein